MHVLVCSFDPPYLQKLDLWRAIPRQNPDSLYRMLTLLMNAPSVPGTKRTMSLANAVT
jgi:hypothetical protein